MIFLIVYSVLWLLVTAEHFHWCDNCLLRDGLVKLHLAKQWDPLAGKACLENDLSIAPNLFDKPPILFPDMFCNFNLVRIHIIVKNKVREKICTGLESLEF